MNKAPYSLIELIRDDDFITWVRRPSPQSQARWEEYLREFPSQQKTIELAKSYIHLIAEDTGRDVPTMKQREKIWGNVKNTIKSENSEN